MKIAYPLQAFGIGDIIWTQTLVRKLAEQAGCDKIVWGTLPHFVDGLNRAYGADIEFVDQKFVPVDYNIKSLTTQGDNLIIPTRWADTAMKVPYKFCMSSKYEYFGMDFHIWKEKAMWRRDTQKENQLFDLLGLSDGKEYTLINKFFGCNNQYQAQIPESGIEMTSISGISLFDWAKVIENAAAIHTVNTSILFLLELLELKAPEVHMYVRKPIEQNFETVDYIFEKNKYILHL